MQQSHCGGLFIYATKPFQCVQLHCVNIVNGISDMKMKKLITLAVTVFLGFLYFNTTKESCGSEPELDRQIQANVKQLLETRRCPKCQLKGADLSGKNLSNADLQNADLSSAKLVFTDLTSANLTRANLNRTLLFGANLKNANLKNANLSFACLSGAVFNNANLEGANLSTSYLLKLNSAIAIQAVQEARFHTPIKLSANAPPKPDTPQILNASSMPSKCDFWYRKTFAGEKAEVQLWDANFTNAKLHKVNLRNSDLSGADLSGLDLQGADLRGANVLGTNLSEANLAYANLSNIRAEIIILVGANLTGANLNYAWFYTAYLKNSNLSEAYLLGASIGIDDLRDPSINLCRAIMPDGKRSTQGCR
jgi:uncharacterized protein YjbI with pentapeptide repeats